MSCKKCFGETSFCQECSNNEEIELLKKQVQFGVDAVNRLLEQNQRLIQYKLDVAKFIDRMKELGQALPPNEISMNIQKALKEIKTGEGEK